MAYLRDIYPWWNEHGLNPEEIATEGLQVEELPDGHFRVRFQGVHRDENGTSTGPNGEFKSFVSSSRPVLPWEMEE